jgi:hypothetical protein
MGAAERREEQGDKSAARRAVDRLALIVAGDIEKAHLRFLRECPAPRPVRM